MANRVTISTIGPVSLRVDPSTEPERALELMIDHWRGRLAQVLPDRPDLVVLPECCDRPTWWAADELRAYYEVRGDRVRDFLAEAAAENRCHIAYSACRRADDGTRRNCTQMIGRSGAVLGTYNKNHLVIGECDGSGITYGTEAALIECDFGRVACGICFDLNFDELWVKYAELQPDLIVFSSMYHGGLVQACRAYQCRSHFVGAIAGPPSAIISPLGVEIASSTNYTDFVTARVNLDCRLAHLDDNQERFRNLKAEYGPGVTITEPGLLGCARITSETDDVGVEQMIEEFEIELLEDYFARSRAHRREHTP